MSSLNFRKRETQTDRSGYAQCGHQEDTQPRTDVEGDAPPVAYRWVFHEERFSSLKVGNPRRKHQDGVVDIDRGYHYVDDV